MNLLTCRSGMWLVLLAIACSLAGCDSGGTTPGTGTSEAPQFISIGTAPLGGAFYQVGAAIADVLNQQGSEGGWRSVTAESTGGTLENIRRLDAGEIELAMANSSITYFAVRGEEGFEKPYAVKAVMTLFPNVAMFVTKKGAGVTKIQDLAGKRVVVGPEGAGFEYFIRPLLRAHGLTYNDFEDVYAGQQTSVGYMADESVAAAFLGGGVPTGSITSAAATMDILLVPYGDVEKAQLIEEYPFFQAATIPAETYRGQDEAFAGLNVGSAQLIARTDAPEEFIYQVTKSVYENRELVAEKHRAGRAINATNAVRNTGTEFHPGAIRFYKEAGIWPDDATAASTHTDPASQGS